MVRSSLSSKFNCRFSIRRFNIKKTMAVNQLVEFKKKVFCVRDSETKQNWYKQKHREIIEISLQRRMNSIDFIMNTSSHSIIS